MAEPFPPLTDPGLALPVDVAAPTPGCKLNQDPARQVVQVGSNRLTLFDTAPELIEAMAVDIETARERVWLESYIISADDAGNRIADALIDRVKAGVDVRVTYDAVGSYATPRSFFRRLSNAGVKVHAYHTLMEALRKLSPFSVFNRRNHRKLLVIDDRLGYFGGMNIVDQRGLDSVEDVKRRDLPLSAGYRDVHVRLEGPAHKDIAAAFDRLWRRRHRQLPKRWPKWPISRMLRSSEGTIWFFDCRPTIRYHRPQRVLVPFIRQARQSITLSIAYFIPIGRVLRQLLQASRRGVEVKVIVPGNSDVKAVQWATRHFYSFLMAHGIQIYERQGCMLHSKAMIVDGEWSMVGSCNLDPRSLRMNLEFLGIIHDRGMAEAMQRICDFEIRNSRLITEDDCNNRPWLSRQLDRFAWTMRRWL